MNLKLGLNVFNSVKFMKVFLPKENRFCNKGVVIGWIESGSGQLDHQG